MANLMNFIIVREMGLRQGLDSRRSGEIALGVSMIDHTPTALVLGHIITSKEAPETERTVLIPPDLVGSNVDEAENRLKELGLVVTRKFEPSESVAKDHVISHTPGPAATAKLGDSVELVVSSGP